MPRNINSSVLSQLTSGSFDPALFVMLTFATVTAYIWSGLYPITMNGQTWTGLGSLLGISTIENGATVEARGITVTLSGLDATLLPDCMTEFKLGLPAAIYFGLFDAGNFIPYPVTAFLGRMGKPTISVTGPDATIAINCESRLIDLQTSPDRRCTQDDQQRYYPGDLGLSMVAQVQERTLYWGGLPLSTNNI